MNKEEIKAQLPSWFKGEVYELGDEVANPYSGETCLLDAAELSMYDCVKGAEYAMLMGAADINECIDVINQGRDWFLIKRFVYEFILINFIFRKIIV